MRNIFQLRAARLARLHPICSLKLSGRLLVIRLGISNATYNPGQKIIQESVVAGILYVLP